MIGIGYQEYKIIRMNEGLPASKIENEGNEKFLVYWGRSHIIDHETGVEARGMLKFGRGKFATALMRGRNEGGADFRIYAEIILDCNEATHVFERRIQNLIEHRNQIGSQGQKELYNIRDCEIKDTVIAAAEILDRETPYNILEVNYYVDNNIQKLAFDAIDIKEKPMLAYRYSTFEKLFD